MLKIHRSNEISNRMAEGHSIGNINMSEVDSEFSDALISESFQKIIECLPSTEKLDFGTMLLIEGDYNTKLEYTIPPETTKQFLECYPGKLFKSLIFTKGCLGFLRSLRFEEIWLLFHLILNEKKIVLVSNNIEILGNALYGKIIFKKISKKKLNFKEKIKFQKNFIYFFQG